MLSKGNLPIVVVADPDAVYMPHQFKKVLRVPLLSSSRKAGVAQRWLLQLCVMPFFKYDMLLFEASSHGEMMMVNAYALNLDRHEEDPTEW